MIIYLSRKQCANEYINKRCGAAQKTTIPSTSAAVNEVALPQEGNPKNGESASFEKQNITRRHSMSMRPEKIAMLSQDAKPLERRIQWHCWLAVRGDNGSEGVAV